MRDSGSASNGSHTGSPDHSPTGSRVGDLAAVARILVKLEPCDEPLQRKRKLVAEFCRLLGEQLVGQPAACGEGLAPRVRQTLERMLAGDSEKQIAGRLGVSPHTVHVYVKSLYRHYDVCSRGELLARFVRGGAGGGVAGGGAPVGRAPVARRIPSRMKPLPLPAPPRAPTRAATCFADSPPARALRRIASSPE